MVVASRDHPDKPVTGYIQKGDFIRLREISARYEVPERFFSRIGGMRSLSLNVSARNIARWTDYRGLDPETDRTGSGDNPDEFQTIGPPSFLIFRINAGF